MIKLYQKLFALNETGQQTMKPTLLILRISCYLWLLALVGCGGDPDRNRIVGDWEIATADRLMGQVNAASIDSDRTADSADLAVDSEPQKPRMLIRFYYSGSLATETNMGSVSTKKYGSWKLLSYDADTRTAKIQCKLVDDTTDFDVIVEDENTLRLVPPNMAGLTKKMKFVRQE